MILRTDSSEPARTMTDVLITVFTKDNPDRLRRTLPQFSEQNHPVVLLDDSVKSEAADKSRQLCEQHEIRYHGPAQQESLLAELPLDVMSRFISELGTEGWTLGKTRNYALLLSIAIDAKKLVMVDDDIQLTGTLDLRSTIHSLDLFDYVGAYIEGMPDHSVVGYLARSAGFHPDCYVSGSFLGIRISEVNNYFLNKYNEDWIWLLLENDGARPPQLGSVQQLKYNPFERALEEAGEQEFGEILLNGVFEAESERVDEQLVENEFWNGILQARERKLQNIGALNIPQFLQGTQELVIEFLIDTVSRADPNEFAQIFESYFRTLPKWQQLLDDTKKTDVNNELIN